MIEKISTAYRITEKGTEEGKELYMLAYVDKDKVTLVPKNYQSFDYNTHGFFFIDSDPEMVIKIGKMIVKAGNLWKTQQ